MSAGPIDWLADFQRDFSAMLRVPLSRSSGTLCADTDRYPEALVAGALAGPTLSARERLAVYNRQYWFRLFGVLQGEMPLVTALVGAWVFNEIASAFLLAHPPSGHDLARVADDLAAFIARTQDGRALKLPDGRTVDGLALVQAARIDEAFRQVFWARAFDPAEIVALRRLSPRALSQGRLRPSGRFVVVDEGWPLIALRARLEGAVPEHPLPLPPPYGETRHFAVFRGPAGVRVLPLAVLQARLYRSLQALPIAAALVDIEEAAGVAGAKERSSALARNIQSWLATSVELGFWEGVDSC